MSSSGDGAPPSARLLQVRDHPLYHFIKARALNKSENYPEAIKTLRMIIKLPALKAEEGKKVRGPSVGPSERASILLELADALRMNGELVRTARLFSPGTGACWRARVGLGTRPFDSG